MSDGRGDGQLGYNLEAYFLAIPYSLFPIH